MSSVNSAPLRRVADTHGELINPGNLLAANQRRWTPHRKAHVVIAVYGGVLSFDAALARWSLTGEELMSWMNRYDRFGVEGLRETTLQHYRN